MLSAFARRIQATIAAHHLLEPANRVLAGVSGGADSVALAMTLRELGYRFGIAHLNHGLRGPESDADECFVADLADRLGVPFFTARARLQVDRGNVEAAGRTARRRFFESVLEESHFDKVALGHHRDDRVETFLLNLTRGAGVSGLTAMPAAADRVIRPFVEIPRGDIEDYLRSQGQAWRTDSTNADVTLARNRMRHRVIPELTRNFNPKLVETVSRTMTLLEDEDRWMRSLTDHWLGMHAAQDGAGFAVDAEALAAAPAALQRRVVRSALCRAGSPLVDVAFDRIEAVRGLARYGKSGKIVELPGGMLAAREFDRLVFRQRPPVLEDVFYDLPVPGELAAPALGKTFRASFVALADGPATPERVFVDGEALGPYVRIRTWKSGDYYRPVGWPAGKLKKLFQRARIPRSRRPSWPVFVSDSGIVWVASFPVSREFVASGRSSQIVALESLSERDQAQ